MVEAELYARLRAEDAEFRRLAAKHQEFERQIGAYDRVYYLTSEQERQRKELQKRKLRLKDEMYAIMRRYSQGDRANSGGTS